MDKEIELQKKNAEGLIAWSNELKIATTEDYQSAIYKLQEIKKVRERWKSYWSEIKQKAYSAWKAICQKENDGLIIYDKIENIIKSKALSWKQEQDRKAADEQRRLQSLADEKARKEKERLEKEAANLKTPEKKEERLEQAASVQAPVITVANPVADINGAHSRTTWKAELVNMADLISAATPGSVAASFLQFNDRAANSFARSTRGNVPVNGIRFYEESSLSVKKEA